MPNDTASIGHNSENFPDNLEGTLEQAKERFKKRTDELAGAANRLPETIQDGDEETAAKVALFVKQIAAHEKDIETERKARKEVYDKLGKMVQEAFKPLAEALAKPKGKAKNLLDDYLQRKERKAREQAERLRAEAAERERQARTDVERQEAAALNARAEQTESAGSKVDTGYGRAVSLRRTWTWEVTDFKALCAAIGRGDIDESLVQINDKAVREHLQNGITEIPGLRCWKQASAA